MYKTITIIFLFFSIISAQEISEWKNFTSFRNANDVVKKGNVVWVATDGGVFGYLIDSESYITLTKSEGLSSQSCTSIDIANDNRVWIGSTEGFIDIYDPSKGEVETIREIYKTDNSNKKINDIQISGDTAFVSFAFGLSLIDTKNLSFFDSILKFGDFTSKTPVYNVSIGEEIAVNTASGIAFAERTKNLVAPESWSNVTLNNIGVDQINRILFFNNKYFLATNNGIKTGDKNSWENFLSTGFNILDIKVFENKLYSLLPNSVNENSTSSSNIYSNSSVSFSDFSIDGSSLYISTNSGLIIKDSEEKFLLPNSPYVNSAIFLTVDNKGNLWSATGKDGKGVGAMKFDGELWTLITKDSIPDLGSNNIHRVASSDKAVYFSTWGAGFVKLVDGVYSVYNNVTTDLIGIPNANQFLAINDIQEDFDGNAWILNYWSADRKPLSVLTKEGNILSYEFGAPLFPTVVNVKELVIDQYNTKWFTGDLSGDIPTDGLFYFNENSTFDNTSDDVWGKLTASSGLRNSDIKALAVDKFGELIIGTSEGVDVIPDPAFPSIIRDDQYFSLRQQTINCIAIDPINQKWFGTEKGIFINSSDGSTLLANFTSTNSPLPTDKIKSIAIDENNGVVYVGTDFGISSISTIFIKPNESYSDLRVYPNPVLLDDNFSTNIIVDGLMENSNIKILDISGNLIKEFRTPGGRSATWDGKDDSGKFVSSGIYLVIAFDEEANEVGTTKVAVIRK